MPSPRRLPVTLSAPSPPSLGQNTRFAEDFPPDRLRRLAPRSWEEKA